ncbi:hypothetical protein GCM10010112_67760 [Actinoplanes lobatus]|uniref:Uncharacterized protein n=1 Tax=Actinoplanes lobatus TaxID=113568 RepID=A0A7W7HEP8_9ACTN|nr:hypothetical protein [Actinoplanes lobatus]MBB4749144.1 hypothetical protein [Actinoplanes lobatus]GGN86334.1 hypothetical protein GCM10010112_67760 [Actinoplanes lobatus]GIE42758.1 hypothetical protein Alo02nite_56560 [Actinoplanes lobatus]
MDLLKEASQLAADEPDEVRAAALLIAAHIHTGSDVPPGALGLLVLEDAKAFEEYILTGKVIDPRKRV